MSSTEVSLSVGNYIGADNKIVALVERDEKHGALIWLADDVKYLKIETVPFSDLVPLAATVTRSLDSIPVELCEEFSARIYERIYLRASLPPYALNATRQDNVKSIDYNERWRNSILDERPDGSLCLVSYNFGIIHTVIFLAHYLLPFIRFP